MAAYAALASLMHIIHKLEHHHSPPISLHKQQLQSLSQHITFLMSFLEAYNPPATSHGNDDELADPLEMRIADAAYAAEDVIESHIVDTIQPSGPGKTSRFFNCFRGPKELDEQIKPINFYQNLQQVIEEMGSIKKMAISIDTENAVAPASVATLSSTEPNTTMVGFDDASLEIMGKLLEDRPDRQVIPIVGMGGIGKTTLARNIYYSQKLIQESFPIRAWATISQQYNTREILCDVLSQATNKDKEQFSGISEDVLELMLHKHLSGTRFLVVMDDMWSIDAWYKIQRFFPNDKNGSRIMITTRLSELSSQLNNNYSHRMDFLDEASSWDLFSKTVFGEKSCPDELEKVGKKIANNCRGLPLSIVVVGGILKKIDATQRSWESIGNNSTSAVNLENDKHCLRLLRLSYYHLPVYLKPCFLYMGVFEEDDDIKVSTLVKLWISEGFLKPMNGGESLETSAKGFLKDLVDRNLVLIGELGSTGNIKSCKIHDLLRDLCLKEGQKDGFYHVVGERSPRGINSQRRIVIPRKTSKRKVLRDLKFMAHVRSVICEYGKVPQCRNLGMLRTFHAYKFGDKSYKHSLVFQYVNLRHLAIQGCNMSSFLLSVNLLWNLHTIIVSCSCKSSPCKLNPVAEIWKMPQLRHIEFVNSFCLPDPPNNRGDGVIIMENLQVLKGVRDFKCCEEVIKRIPNIKKLKIKYSTLMGTDPDDYYPISNIKFLCMLESLSISCTLDFRRSPYLQYLTFPHSLKKLSLCMNGDFKWEDMLGKIGSLPRLEKLKLYCGCFGTGKWEIVEGQFPCLKYLGLFACGGLQHWTAAEESASIFPRLEQIRLVVLEELKNIPREIGNIPTLQRIWLSGCSEAAVKSAKEIVEEQMDLQGEQLSFRVVVILLGQKWLRSLAGPNFEVRWNESKLDMRKLFSWPSILIIYCIRGFL